MDKKQQHPGNGSDSHGRSLGIFWTRTRQPTRLSSIDSVRNLRRKFCERKSRYAKMALVGATIGDIENFKCT